ncbi:hypothetical protein NLU13_1352 [Sarocladium strictum]|uniref:Uncharacterized protein n=1 Tax=Sarocladium strictum TaxID=5046 RepID=A0AA39GQT1_SARSR|nr:hypothetical protein NLU13_1352 [Sarocladium strictum]
MNCELPDFDEHCPRQLLSEADRLHLTTFTPMRNFSWEFTELANPLRTSDTWKVELENITSGIQALANDNFALELTFPGLTPAWSFSAPRSFYQLMSLLTSDASDKGIWDQIVSDRQQRTYLVRGMILKAIESKVFCEALFSFQNAAMRAQHTQEYLRRHNFVSDDFWAGVDTVTTDILTLLLPLYNRVEEECLKALVTVKSTSRADFHQSLHDIVAACAWLSVSMRANDGVVQWTWPKPGTRCTWEQVNANADIYKASEKSRAVLLGKGSIESRATARVKTVITPEISYHCIDHQCARLGSKKRVLISQTVIYYAGDAASNGLDHDRLTIPFADHVISSKVQPRKPQDRSLRRGQVHFTDKNMKDRKSQSGGEIASLNAPKRRGESQEKSRSYKRGRLHSTIGSDT